MTPQSSVPLAGHDARPAAVRFDRVTKRYHLGALQGVGIKHLILHLPRHLRALRQRTQFCALDRVSFEIQRGECFGIIGRNGSGKSTTLGLIAGVLKPTEGDVETEGRIAPLLELGAGFHPELTGRENILLNGVLLGMSRQVVRGQMERIIAFSELGEFVDRPLRVYSSGMIARLGFSVAVHLSPEILLIDEVLAVGDIGFQQKCLAKMQEFRAQGVTMVFVTHNMADVINICDRAALLDAGRLIALGPPLEVVRQYEKLLHSS